MKTKLLLLLVLLLGCSHEYKNPCDCDKITDAYTHQIQREDGVYFETTITTENVCDTLDTQIKHHRTKNQWTIPEIGTCY
jgi:hypothetical protein